MGVSRPSQLYDNYEERTMQIQQLYDCLRLQKNCKRAVLLYLCTFSQRPCCLIINCRMHLVYLLIVIRTTLIYVRFDPTIPTYFQLLANLWRMCKGYGSRSVYGLSVIALAATYLIYKSQVRCYKVPYGILNTCIVWILLETLCFPVLVSFATPTAFHTL